MTITTKMRIYGSLLGVAYGDALGMPTEFMSRQEIEEKFPEGVLNFSPSIPTFDMPRKLMAGEITDDTINTIFVSEMLIDCKGKVEPQTYIDYLLNWVNENPERSDYVSGPSTKRAIDLITQGTPINQSGLEGTTNGSAMKISPIGIVYSYEQIDELIDQVEAICMPTHYNGVSISGAAAIAAGVSYAIRGGNDIGKMWNIAIETAKIAELRGPQLPSASIAKRLEKVRADIKDKEEEYIINLLKDVYGTGVEIIETVPAVLTIITLSNLEPVRAAQIAAGIGGDTDTIGAIAGAICGAVKPCFPEEDINLLFTVNDLPFERLAEGLNSLIKQ